MFLMAVLCVLTLADVQNSKGFIQSVVLPIFESALAIVFEMISVLWYCLTRPLLCLFHCVLAMIIMVLDIMAATLRTPIVILEILLWLPYTIILGLTMFLSNAIGTIIRTFFPIALVLYAFFPGVQQKVREIFASLQQN